MTSTLSNLKPTGTTVAKSTNSSINEDCFEEAGCTTSTLAGGETAGPSTKHTLPPTSSQTNVKRAMEESYSTDSSTSDKSSSSLSATRKQRKKIKKREPTINHLELRDAMDAGEKWEFDLERVHGLSDEEACICVSIVTKHLNEDKLPPANGNRFIELAGRGWKTLKEVDRLVKLYPECLNQAKMEGGWVMFAEGN
jgi:hypothetical protein